MFLMIKFIVLINLQSVLLYFTKNIKLRWSSEWFQMFSVHPPTKKYEKKFILTYVNGLEKIF